MSQIKQRRVRLSMEEKLWILHHREKNPKFSQKKLSMDFTAKYRRTLSRQAICNVLKQSQELIALSMADPELELKQIRNTHSITKAGVVKLILLRNKFKAGFQKGLFITIGYMITKISELRSTINHMM